MNLDLLDQRPDAGITGDLGDGRMKRLIGLMKCVAVACGVGLALSLQDGVQAEDLACRGEARGKARRGLLERLADDDRLRQRGQRNARNEDAGLRKDVDEAL